MADAVMITDITGDRRQYLAMITLRARFKMGIQLKRTDSHALQATRGWMDKKGFVGGRKTMNQCLRWVESEIERLKPEVIEQAPEVRSA